MPKIFAAIIFILLTSCTNPTDLKTIQNSAENSANINSFNTALAKGYEQFAQNTSKYGKSWDAKYFKAKAKMAASGVEVLAEDPEKWEVPDAELPNLMWGAGRLNNVMIDTVKESFPNQLANSQILFDCWLQRASRKMQAEKIEECRMDFVLEMSSLEALLMPVVAESAADENGFKGIIYFNLNSDQVDANGMQIIDNAVAVLRDKNNPALKLYGYTDNSGSKSYNEKLAKKRANKVAKHFTDRGINKKDITLETPSSQEDKRAVEVIVEE